MQICVTVLCWVLLCKFVMCKFVLQLGATCLWLTLDLISKIQACGSIKCPQPCHPLVFNVLELLTFTTPAVSTLMTSSIQLLLGCHHEVHQCMGQMVHIPSLQVPGAALLEVLVEPGVVTVPVQTGSLRVGPSGGYITC